MATQFDFKMQLVPVLHSPFKWPQNCVRDNPSEDESNYILSIYEIPVEMLEVA